MMLEREVLGLLVKHPPEHDYENHPVFWCGRDQNQSGPSAGEIRADVPARLSARFFFQNIFGIYAGTLRERRNPADVEAMLEVYLSGVQMRKKSVARSRNRHFVSKNAAKLFAASIAKYNRIRNYSFFMESGLYLL